jgi:hypothetical protein
MNDELAEASIMNDLLDHVHTLVGSHAVVTKNSHGFSVRPFAPGALSFEVIADLWLILAAGQIGGRWELRYTVTEEVLLAHRIISAITDGRVEETFALARSRVTVQLEDGTTVSETGSVGCLGLLIPQPGWTRWGKSRKYAPYAQNTSSS